MDVSCPYDKATKNVYSCAIDFEREARNVFPINTFPKSVAGE